MKKVLALVLALLMVLSCFTVVTFAEEEADKDLPHTVSMSGVELGCETGKWGGFSYDLTLEGHEGTSCMSKKYEANYKVGANGGCLFSYTPKYAVDVSDMKYLNFMVYTSDASLNGDKMVQFELTSGGTCDVEESSWNHVWNDMVEGGLQNGWNQAKIPLSAFGGGCDWTRWNFMRLYNLNAEGAWVTGEEEHIVAIDDFYFSNEDGTETIEISKCDYAMIGWSTNLQADVDLFHYAEDDVKKKSKLNALAFSAELKGQYNGGGDAFIAALDYEKTVDEKALEEGEATPSIDVSEYRYLVFDLYVSDAAAMGEILACLELSSSGKCDVNELQALRTLNVLARNNLKDGWNTIYVPLQGGFVGGDDAIFNSNSDIDLTMVNYFRIFNPLGFDAGEGMKIAIDNIYFWDGLAQEGDGEAHETIAYTDYTNTASYVKQFNAGWHADGKFSFSDGASSVVLAFPVANSNQEIKDVTFMAKMGSQLSVGVSMTGDKFTEVFTTGEAGLPQSYLNLNLTKYCDFNVSDTVYVKIYDATTEDGNGGRLYADMPIMLDVVYVEPTEAPDPHNDVASPCESLAGWGGVELDKETFSKGKASVSKTLAAKDYNGGGGAFIIQFNAGATKTPTHDTTNYPYFVFDLYLSNAEVAKGISLDFEMTSNGSADVQESHLTGSLGNVLDKYVEGGLKDGWNKVVIPTADFAANSNPACDWSKWNFFRIYNPGPFSLAEEVTFKLDNLRFWDGDDGAQDETYSFTIYSDAEAQFLDPQNKGNENGSLRFNDTTSKTIYEYTIVNIYNTKKVTFSANIQGQYLLEVSQDGKTWVEFDRFVDAECETTPSKQPAAETKTYDLTDKVDLWKSNKIYIRMGDSYPAGGWGGAYTKNAPVTLTVNYVPATAEEKDKKENTATEQYIPLNTCNVKYGSGKLNNELARFGTGCVQFQFTPRNINAYAFDDIDCTGMDTLEFWVYISDGNIINDAFSGGNLELTSAGTCDAEEISWEWSEIWAGVEGGVMKAGEWNHIILPLEAQSEYATCGFRITNVNFIRHFWLDLANPDENAFICFDNWCLTNRQARAKEEAKPEAAPVIAMIAALDTSRVTADNYEAAKAAYNAANDAYKALSSIAKSVAQDDESYKNLSALKKLIGNYESAVEVADTIKALKDLDVTATADNDKTVEKARKAYDKLKEDMDLVPADVVAILTEKEAAIAARGELTPAPTSEPTGEPTGEVTDTPTPTDEDPDDNGNKIVIIIVIAVVVVAAVGVCLWLFVFKKKK